MALGWRGSYIRYRGFFLNIVNLYKQRADLRAFLEVILSITTITIFLVFALKPTALTIIALTGQIKEKKATIVNLDKKISDLQKAQTTFTQNQAAISNLNTAISIRPAPELISKQIMGLAAKDSVNVLSFSINPMVLEGQDTPIKKSKELKPFPEDAHDMGITIGAQGEYTNLLSFVNDLENLRIETKVDTFGIGVTKVKDQTNIVIQITGRIPYLSQ